MYGLEYLLFFGIPENKAELIDGQGRWTFPFISRREAEAHYTLWLQTLSRWKGLAELSSRHVSEDDWNAKQGRISLTLFRRPIRLKLPIDHAAYEAIHATYYRRDFWPSQPATRQRGFDSWWDHGDIRMNLWKILDDLCSRHGGTHSGRVDIAISDSAAVSPSAFYYCPGRGDIMIEGDYFCATPDLIAEILSASSRRLDRGERMEVYRQAGVRNLWLVEPTDCTVEAYQLDGEYRLERKYRSGESIESDLFPGEHLAVADLFNTQSKRFTVPSEPDTEEPVSDWILPRDFQVGLEYFFYLGHPERRWEFWNNKAYSVLAFGSADEASARLDYFLQEAAQWEGISKPKLKSISDDIDQNEVGRFLFTRQKNVVRMDVAVDGRRYKELLKIWGKGEAWEWGEHDES